MYKVFILLNNLESEKQEFEDLHKAVGHFQVLTHKRVKEQALLVLKSSEYLLTYNLNAYPIKDRLKPETQNYYQLDIPIQPPVWTVSEIVNIFKTYGISKITNETVRNQLVSKGIEGIDYRQAVSAKTINLIYEPGYEKLFHHFNK